MTTEEKLSYFKKLGERLLDHRYRYYIKSDNVIEDSEYDILERYYEFIASDLSVSPVASDMVDFDLSRLDAQEARDRVESSTDNYSLWVKEMTPIWNKLGKPDSLKRKDK